MKGAQTSEAMAEAARLNWSVRQRPLRTVDGVDVPDHFANVRSDTGAVLGVVGKSYNVIQNGEAFDFLDSLLQDGLMRYESAGSLRGGRIVWALARMPGFDSIAENDGSLRYVLFSTSHDGSASVYAMPTSVRVVCANTLAIATGRAVGIRHTGNTRAKLETARRLISQYDEQFTLFRDSARKLASVPMKRADAEAYLSTLFPEPAATEPRKRARWAKELRAVFANLQNDRQTIPSIRGSWWAMVNAVTETVDHLAAESSSAKARELRFWSRMNGTAAEFKAKAFSEALKLAAV